MTTTTHNQPSNEPHGEGTARRISSMVRGLQRSRVRALTAAVEAVQGVNMGQGNNLLPTPAPLVEAAHRAMLDGRNDYSIQEGIESLRIQVSRMLRERSGIQVDPESEVRITSGATGGFYSAFRVLLEPGDEAILLEPYYPYHLVALLMTGCTPVFARLSTEDWSLDFDAIEAACTSRTRVLVLCNPSNPTGRVYREAELKTLVEFCISRGITIVADEVYEQLTYDGLTHVPISALPGASQTTLTVASFSKSHAITGWRIGYIYGP